MWEFEVDGMVVCIDDEFEFVSGEKTPVLNSIYTVRELINDDGELCLRLYEIVNPEIQYGDVICECMFLSDHFRPVKKTDISLFNALLKKKPTKEEIDIFTDDMTDEELKDVFAL